MQKEARGRLAGSGTVAECVGAEEEEDEAWRRCIDPRLGLVVEDGVADAGGARGLDGEAGGGRRLR